MKIIHIITGLSTGGAEMMLYKLLSRMDRNAFEAGVISLTDLGPVADRITSLGIPVSALGMTRGRPHPVMLWRLARLLREHSPDIVQTWLYHSDLIGGLAARLAGNRRISWSIRQSNIDADSNKRSTVWTARTCAMLSSWLPERIICCSHSAMESHLALRYARQKMVVIPNGFDLEAFRPDHGTRARVRQELGLDHAVPLIGLVARFDPQKDHQNFIEAAARVGQSFPSVHFVLCGKDITPANPQLMAWIGRHGLSGRCHLLGIRDDVPRLVAALDIAVSSSLREGFPNVVGEAMACAVPCVVTDVGDSALIVGDTGIVVPPRDPEALAGGIIELLDMPPAERNAMGRRARERVEREFSLDSVVRQYEDIFHAVADRHD